MAAEITNGWDKRLVHVDCFHYWYEPTTLIMFVLC